MYYKLPNADQPIQNSLPAGGSNPIKGTMAGSGPLDPPLPAAVAAIPRESLAHRHDGNRSPKRARTVVGRRIG